MLFSCEFLEIIKNPFVQNTSGRLLLDFFIHFTAFATIWTNKNQVFFISFFYLFLKMFYHERDECHEFKRPSCCCIGTYISRWHHIKFSGALCTDYWISVLPCLAIIDLDIRLGLKWNLGSCHEVFCKKGVLKYLLKFSGKYLCQSLFF